MFGSGQVAVSSGPRSGRSGDDLETPAPQSIRTSTNITEPFVIV